MATTQRRRGGALGFVVGFGIGIPATIFALSNLEATNVEFLGWQAQVPLWAVIAASMLLGAVFAVAMLLAWQARRKRGRKKAAKAVRQVQQQAAVEAASESSDPALGSGLDGGRAGSGTDPAADLGTPRQD